MSLSHYLFSFSGRANRAKQWALLLVGLVFTVINGIAFGVLGVGSALMDAANAKNMQLFFHSSQLHNALIVAGVLVLIMYYIVFAVTAKRLHDRNKSAWWMAIFYLLPLLLNIPTYMMLPEYLHMMQEAITAAQNHLTPPQPPQNALATLTNGAATIISLWAFVELYCLAGTSGPNRYGEDPLAPKAV